VILVEYNKPEIDVIGDAASTIQSSQLKVQQITLDMPQSRLATTPAYEADE
jgi:hypothetical protein